MFFKQTNKEKDMIVSVVIFVSILSMNGSLNFGVYRSCGALFGFYMFVYWLSGFFKASSQGSQMSRHKL